MRPRSMSARNTSPIRASLADDMPTVYGSARGRGSAAAAANDSASNGRNNERIFMRIFSLFKSAILRSFFLDSADHRFFPPEGKLKAFRETLKYLPDSSS